MAKLAALRKVRITGDGTAAGTKVVDAETGERINLCQKIEISLKPNHLPLCELTILAPFELDLTADSKIKVFRIKPWWKCW